MAPSLSRRRRQAVPLGNDARAARAVASGTGPGPIASGCSDMVKASRDTTVSEHDPTDQPVTNRTARKTLLNRTRFSNPRIRQQYLSTPVFLLFPSCFPPV